MDLLVGDFAYMYEVLPPLTPEQEAEKAALTPAFEEARARHNDLLIEYSELTRAGQVVPAELQARIDASNEVYGPLSKQMSAFNRKKTRTHGWVWLYLGTDGERAAPAPAAPVQASKEFGPTELTVEASPLPGDPGTWRIESTLSMDQGWYTYARVPEGRPYPATRPALIGPEGSELPVTWKALSKEWPDPDEAMQSLYTDAALFVCEVELSAEALETLEVSMNFQVCNTEVCLPPTVLSVSLRATPPD
jgi:hypothetical protein